MYLEVRISIVIITIIGLCSTYAVAQQTIPASEKQIQAAVSAAPEAMRSGAKVYGYNQQGRWATLREGNNDLICISDDPEKPKFHVVCYYKGLEPFMKRGRELKKEGKSKQETDEIRRKEIESGKLTLPRKAMTLYSLSGRENAYNYETGTLKKAQPLTVVYLPFGTQKSTGMTTSPAGPGGPWLMEAGTPWAHIMIPGEPRGAEPGGDVK